MMKNLSFLKGHRIKSSAKDKDTRRRTKDLICRLKLILKLSWEDMINIKLIKLRKRDGLLMRLQLDITTPKIHNI